MNLLPIVVRFVIGVALGLFFYGGLWMTVRQLPLCRHPGWLMLGSFWLRSAAVVAVFLFAMNQRWEYAAVCLVGFTAGRVALSTFLPVRRTAS